MYATSFSFKDADKEEAETRLLKEAGGRKALQTGNTSQSKKCWETQSSRLGRRVRTPIFGLRSVGVDHSGPTRNRSDHMYPRRQQFQL
jgi:hypothetical protein